MTAGHNRIWGHGNFLRFWPIHWTQWDPIGHKVDPRWSTSWFCAITVKSNFGRNRWPRGSRIIEFEGMVIFYGFDPFFGPNGHKVDPRWSTPWFCAITVKSNFGRNRWPRGSRKFEFGGMVIFYGGDQFLDPIGHKVVPRWSAPWFCPITVKSNFGRNRWPRGSRKVEFGGMVIFYGGDPIFGPNGIPLAPRWTLGSPHCDLAP